ncbi:hypothetical protein PRUPE_6G339400 [Prunus persica]|uniref:Uncharacterized protein n=1 Tax=Prunus persica TaxID=3760 RepID=A0A251NZQ7_PRUPE|nr:hypothetical protein PRUPE_6G339400 [Prunus persica]
MATASLLQPNPLKWKHSSCPFLLPPLRPLPTKPIKFSSTFDVEQASCNFKVKCFKHSTDSKPDLDDTQSVPLVIKDNPANPLELIASKLLNALKALRKPAMAAVLLGLLLMSDPNSALAASGGRVGGNSFSSRSSSSSSSSRSYSVPRTSSSRPDFSYSAPYYAPSPFGFSGGGGVYVGPAFGFGVGAGSSFFLILTGFAAFVLVSGFLSDRSEGSVLTATEKTTVLKLQVGLLGMGRALQRDLNRIAETADTSTSEGLGYVLTETTLALLRHPDYCISGYSSVSCSKARHRGCRETL